MRFSDTGKFNSIISWGLPLVAVVFGCAMATFKLLSNRAPHVETPWGEPVAGLQCRVIPTLKQYFLTRQEWPVIVEFRNNQAQPLKIPDFDPPVYHHQFFGLDGEKMLPSYVGNKPPPKVIPIDIAPQQTVRFHVDLKKCPGRRRGGTRELLFDTTLLEGQTGFWKGSIKCGPFDLDVPDK